MPKKGFIASYQIAQLTAQRKTAHTKAESIIAPALAIIVETMLEKEATDYVKKVLLFNDTISRRNEDLTLEIKKSKFSTLSTDDDSELLPLCINESKDISRKAQFLLSFNWLKMKNSSMSIFSGKI